MWRLTPIQDTKVASQLHISIPTTPSRIQDMCLTSTQVLFHLDLGSKILVSPPYMYCLNPIQVHVITSHLPPDSVSTPSMSWYLYVTSIQVTSHLHPGLKMYVHLYQCPVSPPTRPFTKVAFHLNPCPDISAPSPISPYQRSSSQDVHMYCIICIQVTGKMQLSYTQAPSQTHTGPLHLHPGPASPASRSKGSYIIAIPVPSHLHPNHISYSVSSRGVHLKSTNVQSQLHPKPLDLHLNPFRVVPHFHPGCVSPPPR